MLCICLSLHKINGMKIGFDAKRAMFNHRGLGNYSRDTIRIVAQSHPDDEILMFSPKSEPLIPFDYPKNCKIIAPSGFFWKSMPSLWRSSFMYKTINEMDVDVYHGLSHELPFGIEKTRVRKVLTMHDLIFVKYPQMFPYFDRKMYNIKYRHSCDAADHIIAVSERTKRDLMECWNIDESRISVVYQGCNPRYLNVVSEAEKAEVRRKYNLPEGFVFNIGAIEERKNQVRLIEAVARLKDVPLVIAGRKSKYQEELENAVMSADVRDRVFIVNNVETDDLPALYQSAAMFAFPSLFEGFGIPVLEALYSGLPVVAATGSCLEESGGPGSVYVNPEDVEEMSDAINNVLCDSELREKMRVANAGHLDKFNDESIAKQLNDIYKG